MPRQIFPVSGWAFVHELPEQPSEIITVGKPAFEGDFGYVFSGVVHQFDGLSDANSVDVIAGRFAECFIECTVETTQRHVGNPGELFGFELFVKVGFDVADGFGQTQDMGVALFARNRGFVPPGE